MKRSMKGEIIIPSIAWRTMASAYRQIASDLSLVMNEIPDIRDSLKELQSQYQHQAELCERVATETKPGRPPKIEPANKLLLTIQASQVPKTKKVGRPKNGPDYDDITFRAVVERQSELQAGKKSKPWVVNAVKSLIAEAAVLDGRNTIDAIKKDLNIVKSAFQRGKKSKIKLIG